MSHDQADDFAAYIWGGVLRLSGPLSRVETAVREVKALQERQGRLVTVDLHELAIDPTQSDAQAWPEQATLDAEAAAALLRRARAGEDGLRLRRTVTLSALTGQKALFFDGVRHSFLGDFNRSANSAGGGGMVPNVVAVSDPEVSECASGLLLKLRGHLADGEDGPARLDIAFSTCRFDGLETVDTVGGKIETPRLTVYPLRAHLELRPGQAAVLSARPPAAPGKPPERQLYLIQRVAGP